MPLRRLPVRGRRSLLWGLATFLLGQLLLAAAIECRLPQLRDPLYGDKERRLLERLAGPPRPVIVMLGSSRTEYAFRAADVERHLAGPDGGPTVFNFGIAGGGPLMELLTLRRLLGRGVRPQLLLVEVLPPALAGQVDLADLARMVPERLSHADLSLMDRYAPSARLRSGWWTGWPLPCHSHRFALLSEVCPALLPAEERLDRAQATDDAGWTAMPSFRRGHADEHRKLFTERAHAEYARALDNFRLGGPGPGAVRELLSLCRRKAIPVVLVLMPEGAEFRRWYSPAAWSQIDAFLAELGRAYEVDVINARDWLPESSFADSHHQLPEGAARFSERLAREVIGPRLNSFKGRAQGGEFANAAP